MLAWDEFITPPYQTEFTEWKLGRGFEVEDAAGRVPIANADLGTTSVHLKLGRPLQGNKIALRCALTRDGVQGPSQNYVCRGQLRDSDSFSGRLRRLLRRPVARGRRAREQRRSLALIGLPSRLRALRGRDGICGGPWSDGRLEPF